MHVETDRETPDNTVLQEMVYLLQVELDGCNEELQQLNNTFKSKRQCENQNLIGLRLGTLYDYVIFNLNNAAGKTLSHCAQNQIGQLGLGTLYDYYVIFNFE